MPTLIAIAFAGFFAQLVDGSLGMGYGVTSTTLLLTLGLAPALASASVHLAEIGTSGVSGVSHWRSATSTAASCCCSASRAASAPSSAPSCSRTSRSTPPARGLARPARARRRDPRSASSTVGAPPRPARPARPAPAPAAGAGAPRRWALVPLGLVGGFLDASGGGGWGPVTTSTLMAPARMQPRTIIGTVSGSEFIVSIAASVGFLLALGSAGIDLGIVAMMLIGGAIAAPLSAWLVSRFDDRALGTGVGGLIIFLNVDRALCCSASTRRSGWRCGWSSSRLAVVVVGWLFLRSRNRSAAAAAGVRRRPDARTLPTLAA